MVFVTEDCRWKTMDGSQCMDRKLGSTEVCSGRGETKKKAVCVRE